MHLVIPNIMYGRLINISQSYWKCSWKIPNHTPEKVGHKQAPKVSLSMPRHEVGRGS